MKTQEQVWTQQEVPAGLWPDANSREGFWQQMRQQAVQVAAGDGKTLTDTPGTREVLYLRMVSEPGYPYRREAECTEAEAEFVRLRLYCWAEKQ